ncbi:MAG: acetylxylan esterase [Cyclobacteriaceae bacterium]
MKKSIAIYVGLLFLLSVWEAKAQPSKKLVEVVVTPTKTDWTYKLGERADFNIQILRHGQVMRGVKVKYSVGYEKMPVEIEETIELAKGTTTVKGIKGNKSGFIRCKVTVEHEGTTYTDWGTAGFEPDKIVPTVNLPKDFDTFWNDEKLELAKLPMDAKVTLVPEQCTGEINVYHVNLQNIRAPYSWRGNSRFYGMLSVPKKPGRYPAILGVPGAGVRAYGRDDRAAKGVIVFKVGIHGIPVNMPSENYQSLATGALAGYQVFNIGDRDKYYFKRVYMGCVRAIDFIYSLPEFDGEELAVTGGSQGGALSIITAGLDSRIKYLAAFYPALSDLTGYKHGRAGGWPHISPEFNPQLHPDWEKTIEYYDVVNFARKLKAEGWYSWGYNDNVCPPTSMHAAYNSVEAPKELHKFLETEHWTFPEQRDEATDWLIKKLTE